MIRMIAAVSSNGVIGIDGKIPFDYPADMKHFRNMTLNSIVIMGRKTFESMGKPLLKRRNIVISKIANGLGTLKSEGIEIYNSIEDALAILEDPIPLVGNMDSKGQFIPYQTKDIWFIGGAKIYEIGMNYADEIHLTITPDRIDDQNAVKFPWINPLNFNLVSRKQLVSGDDDLQYCIYKRI